MLSNCRENGEIAKWDRVGEHLSGNRALQLGFFWRGLDGQRVSPSRTVGWQTWRGMSWCVLGHVLYRGATHAAAWRGGCSVVLDRASPDAPNRHGYARCRMNCKLCGKYTISLLNLNVGAGILDKFAFRAP